MRIVPSARMRLLEKRMEPMLKDGAGIPKGLLRTLAVVAGISVANLYLSLIHI